MSKELRALLKKEFTIAGEPWFYIMALLGTMTAIPKYPAIVGAGYCFLALFSLFRYYNATRDMEFNAILPIKRNDIVLAKSIFVLVYEAVYLLIAVLGAVLANYVISPAGNAVGLDPNFTFFGVVMLGYGVFNVIFLTSYFKTGYKPGLGTLFGVLAFVAVYAIAETVVQLVPALTISLDALTVYGICYRILAAAVGLVAWLGLSVLGIRLSKKQFDKVSL